MCSIQFDLCPGWACSHPPVPCSGAGGAKDKQPQGESYIPASEPLQHLKAQLCQRRPRAPPSCPPCGAHVFPNRSHSSPSLDSSLLFPPHQGLLVTAARAESPSTTPGSTFTAQTHYSHLADRGSSSGKLGYSGKVPLSPQQCPLIAGVCA